MTTESMFKIIKQSLLQICPLFLLINSFPWNVHNIIIIKILIRGRLPGPNMGILSIKVGTLIRRAVARDLSAWPAHWINSSLDQSSLSVFPAYLRLFVVVCTLTVKTLALERVVPRSWPNQLAVQTGLGDHVKHLLRVRGKLHELGTGKERLQQSHCGQELVVRRGEVEEGVCNGRNGI